MKEMSHMKGKQQVNACYANDDISYLIEDLEGFYQNDADIAELIQDQESVYLSFQTKTLSKNGRSSASTSQTTSVNQNDVHQEVKEKQGESSGINSTIEKHLSVDEALARSLQELENQVVNTSFTEAPRNDDVNRDLHATLTSLAAQGHIDPDNMTYEELQSLGETIGTECRGLSDELISYLPSSKYKSGLFSRKEKQNCVICCMMYKNRDILITLPCKHHYHSNCITQWLRINKTCPMCYEEVFGS